MPTMELGYCWNYTIAGVTDEYAPHSHSLRKSSMTGNHGFPPKVEDGWWLGKAPDGYIVKIKDDKAILEESKISYVHDSQRGNYFRSDRVEIGKCEWTPTLHLLAKDAEQFAHTQFAKLKEAQLVYDAQWRQKQEEDKHHQAKEAESWAQSFMTRKQEVIAQIESLADTSPVHEFVTLEAEPKATLINCGCFLLITLFTILLMVFAH